MKMSEKWRAVVGAPDYGEKHGGSKLCNSDVSRIREARLFGASRKDLASVWGVGLDTISEITSGKTWRHVCQN